MRHEMAMTKNVRRTMASVGALMERPAGLEGMGIIWGIPGEGKTTTLAYVANQVNGVYVRVMQSWSTTALLEAMCHELGLPPGYRRAAMARDVVQALAVSGRPVFIDEADYLIKQPGNLETLRDIYDMAPGIAMILVGMENLAREIQKMGRLARRISQWIEFTGIDFKDARILVDTVCERRVADDLVAHLHHKAKGNIGRMVLGLAKIETKAKTNGLDLIDLATWGDDNMFYDQPNFGRRRAD